MCSEEQIRAIVRKEMEPVHVLLDELVKEARLSRQWTSMPDDYKLAKDLPPGQMPRTIKIVVYDAIVDLASWTNILKLAASLTVLLTAINQAIRIFGWGG